MKTFYIFKLNKVYNSIAKRNPESIFMLLSSIYQHNKHDVLTAYNLFSDICLPINKNFFNNYIFVRFRSNEEYTKFKNVHMYNNYFTNETSKIEIFKSFIRVKSNMRDNTFSNLILELDNMFLCEFDNELVYMNKYLKNKEIKV